MEQKYYIYYCKYFGIDISEGMRCFRCEHCERPRPEDLKPGELKKCRYEKVIKEGIRIV